jgi:hypothetical protein
MSVSVKVGRSEMGKTGTVRRACAASAASALVLVAGCSAGGSTPAVGHSPTVGPSSNAAPTKIPSVHAALPGIERFVEHERGLHFKRPVKSKLLGRKAFLAQLHKGQHAPKPKAVEKLTGTMSSLGLISPHTDIAKAFKTAYDSNTLGFYNFKTKRLFVRGTRATPGVRAVLSHELTHALTDQWFGLRRPKLNKSNQELGLGFTALTEGDAERTRMAYEAQELNAADRRIAEREESGSKSAPHVPQIVLELIGFPYAIGPDFVRAVVAHGGIKALNAAYRHPPTSSEQLLNPAAYFSHDDPKHVATPSADGVRIDHGDLGLVGLLLMFEHGLDRATAQSAVIGWGGDQYTTWRVSNNHWCLRDSVVMDSTQATINFDTALATWVATRHGKAQLEQQGQTTTFVTCSG